MRRSKAAKSEDYPERWALVFALVALTFMVPYGFAEPWFVRHAYALFQVASMVAGSSILGFVTGLAIAAFRRRLNMATIVAAAMCVGATAFVLDPLRKAAAWDRQFQAIRPELNQAVAWARALNDLDDRGQVALPARFASLAERGRIAYYRDSEGRIWYLFIQYVYSIDNGFGFAWCEEDLPPPRPAFCEVVRTERIGGGWYRFWTT